MAKRMDETSRTLKLRITLDREEDGRWIAEVPDLPGVMVYGRTRRAAVVAAKVLALRVLADRIEHGELELPDASHRPLDVSLLPS